MKFENIQNLRLDHFRRITGVKPTTFAAMVDTIKIAHKFLTTAGGGNAGIVSSSGVLVE